MSDADTTAEQIDTSAPAQGYGQGPVIPIGGGEEKDGTGDQQVLTRFAALAGGKRARIIVVPTASETPEEMGRQYDEVFGTLGAKTVEVLDVRQREDANAQARSSCWAGRPASLSRGRPGTARRTPGRHTRDGVRPAAQC